MTGVLIAAALLAGAGVYVYSAINPKPTYFKDIIHTKVYHVPSRSLNRQENDETVSATFESRDSVGHWLGEWFHITVDIKCSYDTLIMLYERQAASIITVGYITEKNACSWIRVYGWYTGWVISSLLYMDRLPKKFYKYGKLNSLRL